MNDVQGDQGFSIYRLRWIGYGLLILSVLDTIATLIPARFWRSPLGIADDWGNSGTGASSSTGNGADIFWRRVRPQKFGKPFFEAFVLGVSAARSGFSVDAAFGNFWHYLRQQPKQPAN